jgi:molybdate transport repressor ModE-like protein
VESGETVTGRLDREAVRFAARDAELLRAIGEYGSLNAVTDAPERSYSRSQQRVVELEDAAGQLVERQRGGPGSGGSSLTETPESLLAEFDRLEVEFAGLTVLATRASIETLGLFRRVVGPRRPVVCNDTKRSLIVGFREGSSQQIQDRQDILSDMTAKYGEYRQNRADTDDHPIDPDSPSNAPRWSP